MSAADEAYRAAVKVIERARKAGEVEAGLDLSRNAFRALERLPDEIAGWAGLQVLNLSDTQITDAGLAPIAGLSGLRTLLLNGTKITDAGLAKIVGLARLQELHLNGTKITDAGLAQITGLKELQELYLGGTQITDIGLAQIAGLNELRDLYLSGTQISDLGLAHISERASLTRLILNETQVTDLGLAVLTDLEKLESLFLNDTLVTNAGLEHIAKMQALVWLGLGSTKITQLDALTALKNLQSLNVSATRVRDLRPICDIRLSADHGFGLTYEYTTATELDPKLAELAGIKEDDERTTQTLAYLKSLPKYPAPLPWLQQEEIPSGKPAPLQVLERDGKLIALRGDTLLSDASDLLAAQAWKALRDFLDDIADQRARIHNTMPALGRALARFEDALAASYDLCNPIALGMHGGRVIRLAPDAAESLSKADAAEVVELAAAIALFLERFPAWRDYRDDATPRTITAQDVAAIIPLIRNLDNELRDYHEIDESIPKQLDALAEAAQDAPDDPIAARGLIDSATNVLAALASKAMPALKWVAKQPVEFGKAVAKRGWNLAADAGVAALGAAGYHVLINNTATLYALAAKYPAAFQWIANLLTAFGL